MYSGLTIFTKYSGRILGAHQKIDRVARRQLATLLPDNSVLPPARKILQFEGLNGPDGIKRKSPAVDEPWHYLNPFDDSDTQLLDIIQEHYRNLVRELRANNHERVAFETAWLAHAIVDGLTPAHHYPYEEKLVELRGGEGLETRTTFKTKLVMPGDTKREQVKNNWKMWGPKGLFTTHASFEMGVATLIAPLAFGDTVPSEAEIVAAQKLDIKNFVRNAAREIAVLNMYEAYYKKGWTPKLANQVRHKLAPIIIKSVTLAWYMALVDAGMVGKNEGN
jgi:hypothetical protein